MGSTETSNVECEISCGDRYSVIQRVGASEFDTHIILGKKGRRRYCGTSSAGSFRATAHLFPEFLGNKRIVSADECDKCNQLFKQYDSALAHYLKPYLTLGNVRGKRGVPVTKGDGIRIQGGSGTAIEVENEACEYPWFDPLNREILTTIPMPQVRFRPRFAFKSLTKMGLGLLPEDEIQNFQKLVGWIQEPLDQLDFPVLEVALSYAHIMRPIPIVCGFLLRRTNPCDELPYMLFILQAGAICAQIQLMPDVLDDHIDFLPMGTVNINARFVLHGGENDPPITITYTNKQIENWYSQEPVQTALRPISLNIKL